MARACPHCRSTVPNTATVCAHCARDLPPLEQRPSRHWPTWQVVLIILAVFAIVMVGGEILA